jgi:AraC-like DNA-binding protein
MLWSLDERGQEARLCCEPVCQRGEAARFTLELLLGLALRMGERLLPVPARHVSVQLRGPTPSHAARLSGAFGVRVEFASQTHAIVFPRGLLDVCRPADLDNPMLESMRELTETLLAQHAQRPLAERVRALLLYEGDLSQFDVERVANVLGFSERSLRRRLAEEGVPLADLLGEVRRALAIEAMQQSDVAIKQLSEQLGFSEPSAFHRAFKRWTGSTPSEYLRAQAARRSSAARCGQPRHDARVEASGVFEMHEVSERAKLLHQHV